MIDKVSANWKSGLVRLEGDNGSFGVTYLQISLGPSGHAVLRYHC